LESVHKRCALAKNGKNLGLVDGQLEKREKGKERKMTAKQSLFHGTVSASVPNSTSNVFNSSHIPKYPTISLLKPLFWLIFLLLSPLSQGTPFNANFNKFGHTLF
jgi:hypothetical protein